MQTYSLGVAIFIIRNDALLLTYRIKGAQMGVWEVPSGHIEGDETPAETAARELFEETGLVATALRPMGVCVSEPFHFKATMFLATADGVPENLDERNHSALVWHHFDNLPAHLGATTKYGLTVLGLNFEA